MSLRLVEELADLREDLRVRVEWIEVREWETAQPLHSGFRRPAGGIGAFDERCVAGGARDFPELERAIDAHLDHGHAESPPGRDWHVRIKRDVRCEHLPTAHALVRARTTSHPPGWVHRIEMTDAGERGGALGG